MNDKVFKRITEVYSSGITSKSKIAKTLQPEFPSLSFNSIRLKASRFLNKIKSKAFYEECESIGIDPETVTHYWYKGKHYSINAKANKYEFDYDDFKSDLIDEISKWSPNYPVIARDKYK